MTRNLPARVAPDQYLRYILRLSKKALGLKEAEGAEVICYLHCAILSSHSGYQGSLAHQKLLAVLKRRVFYRPPDKVALLRDSLP